MLGIRLPVRVGRISFFHPSPINANKRLKLIGTAM